MEHYHDFPRDSCVVDGVSIAESLLYKDAEEIRSHNFSSNNTLQFTDPRSNLGSAPLAPMNAVAAAAFGSAYSRTASGGLEEVCMTNECSRPIDDNSVMNINEQELTSIPLTSPYCSGNNVTSSCDSSYSKWNELVNKIVDSQEDIPSLLLESVKERNRSTVDCRDLTSAANVLFMRVNQLGDYVANKTTNGRSPSSSSNGSSSVTAIGETCSLDHPLVNKSCFDSSTKISSTVGGEYGGYTQTPFSVVNSVNNWPGNEEGVYSSVSHLSDANINVSNPSGLFRNELKWTNNYCVDNVTTEVEANTLHRVNTEPILSTIPSEIGTKNSGSRLRPIIGKCSDENLASIVSASPTTPSANVSGIQSLNLFNQGGGGSHLLPLLRKSAPQLMESNLSDRKPEATAVSSLMASTVVSHAFNSGQNTTAGVLNGNLSSVTTQPFHLTADSLRLASRSQLNPNAEKFVFVPSSSNNGSNAIIHQQQHHPLLNQHLQQHHYHHTHAQHQQHQQSQQFCVSTAPYFQTKHNSVNSAISQGNLSGSSAAGNISLYTNSGNMNSSIAPIGTNATGATSTNTVSSLPSTLSHHLLSLGTISPVTYNFQSKFNILVEQRKSLDRERNRIEAELCRQYPGKRITTGVCGANVPPTVKSCNSSDRVDRELNTVLGNHARVVTLISKMEKLQNGGEPLPSHVHSTMECWLEGIRKCQARRKEELVNMTNRQRSGPRQQDEKDVVALTLALAELTEHMRRARTALWAALQMTHKDRASSATDAFRFLDHVRRHGLMVLMPPLNTMANSSTMSSLSSGSGNTSAVYSNEGILSATLINSTVSTTRSLMNLP